MMTHIELEGVRVHNLRGVSLRIPHHAVTVICGVSGSGKSSLAFDTLFAEGQRRYVDTFSPQARQFLSQLERPDVDRIEGVPPAIAVRQQGRLTNALSTVGSRTEILRYLQLLFAQTGQLHCPACGSRVQSWTSDSVAADMSCRTPPARALIAFPAAGHSDVGSLLALGFTRGIAGTNTVRLEDLDTKCSTIDLLVVVDRVRTRAEDRQRTTEAVQQAFEQASSCRLLIESADGDVVLDGGNWDSRVYHDSNICSSCDLRCPSLTQDLLSFHTAAGACAECAGTGAAADSASSDCPSCGGTRLNRFARSVRLHGSGLPDQLKRECGELLPWLEEVQQHLSEAEVRSLRTVLDQLQCRLRVLTDIGLGYLSLDRTLMTLSGGEARRVVLSAVLGSGLINTLYVLDEPTSGMHETDIDRVILGIRRLQADGNTVVVVEHDAGVICSADHVVELGPQAGRDGGTVVFEGTPENLRHAATHTGAALRETGPRGDAADSVERPVGTVAEQWLQLRNVQCHNIDGAAVDLPLQTLCVVTGVSGSGKSSLLVDALYPELQRILGKPSTDSAVRCEIAGGIEQVGDVQLLEQNPLQRSSRSTPATYVGAFDEIRKVLADTHEARKRSFTPGTFSFNSARGGRCERCHGHGVITIDLQFLADVETTCETCRGRRFREEVLEVRYRDRSVDEILSMTAEEAFAFFSGHHRIQRSLNGLRQTGLGYLSLGQRVSTLSGGEAQRLRIAALLAGVPNADRTAQNPQTAEPKRARGTLFILDEPSNGLHAHDADRLMNCLRQLVQVGHSVVIIEHDRRLIDQCDYRIEMGPGAGRHGGKIISAAATSLSAERDAPECE